jgi:hypothetical protein
MESITRQVSSLEPAVREALEGVVGHSLQPSQQIVVQVLDANPAAEEPMNKSKLPDWCGIFSDLTTDEEAALALSIAGRTESRSISMPGL